jgi:hypothetical protein
MASQRQIEANRRNGSLGGPKTEAGKQRSRLSSIKHGLTASTIVVLPEEDSKEYEEILRGFQDSLQPEGSVEDALVLRLAQAHWRSLRSRRIETGMLGVTVSLQCHRARKEVENCPEHLNAHNAIGVGFLTMPPEQWQTYLRYDTTISRDFFKTLDALTKLQRIRRQRPAPKRALTAASGAGLYPAADFQSANPSRDREGAAELTASQVSDSGIRSVSQDPPPVPNRVREQAVTPPIGAQDPRRLTINSPASPVFSAASPGCLESVKTP